MKETESVEPSDMDADRRQILIYMGSSVLALGVMSMIPFARADTMSNEMPVGANNFYTSDLVTIQKVNFPNKYGMKIVGNLILPNNRDASTKLAAILVGHHPILAKRRFIRQAALIPARVCHAIGWVYERDHLPQ